MAKPVRRHLPEDSLAALAELARILGGSRAAVDRFFEQERMPLQRLARRLKKPRPRRSPGKPVARSGA